MSLKHTLFSGLVVAALSVPAFADQTDFSFPVHDIIITSNIPTVNISVRNMSSSTDPADRDLRVVSPTPVIPVSGQVWCKTFQQSQTAALRAQIMFGNVNLVAQPNGAGPAMFGTYSPSSVATFNGTHTLENFAIDAALDVPDTFDRHSPIDLDLFNPVRVVENRLEQFVENGAGSEADFMRVDDVFEIQITLNAVGWCNYDAGIIQGEYAGFRAVPVTVAIFYHGDVDIQDVIQTVSGADSIAAPVPNRARATTSTQGSSATPPARDTRPARARPSRSIDGKQNSRDTDNDGTTQASSGPSNPSDVTSGEQAEAGLLLPAVQSAREAARSNTQSRRRGAAVVEDMSAASARPGVEPEVIGAPSQPNAGVEPDEIDTRASAPQAAPLDALLVINRASDED